MTDEQEERVPIVAAQPIGLAAIEARIDKLSDRIDSIRESKAAALRDYQAHVERENLAIAEHNQLVYKFNSIARGGEEAE